MPRSTPVSDAHNWPEYGVRRVGKCTCGSIASGEFRPNCEGPSKRSSKPLHASDDYLQPQLTWLAWWLILIVLHDEFVGKNNFLDLSKILVQSNVSPVYILSSLPYCLLNHLSIGRLLLTALLFSCTYIITGARLEWFSCRSLKAISRQAAYAFYRTPENYWTFQ